MNRTAPARRLCLTAAVLFSLSGVAGAQLVQPPPAAEKPAAPAKVSDLRKPAQPAPAPIQPASAQPVGQPGGQPGQAGQPGNPPVDAASLKDRPQLAFETQTHQFGKISDTENADAIFKFTNKGNQTLVISDIHASCGCTVPKLEKTEYAPGESGEFKVSYNPRNKHGVQNQTVTITSNDPASPRTMVTIQADVQPVITIEPVIAQTGTVRKGEERKVSVTITLRDPESKVTDVTSSDPDKVKIVILKNEVIDLDGKPANRCTLEATVSPKSTVGRIQVSGTVRTTDKNKPIVSFQVMGDIEGDIYKQPARMSFGSVRPGSAIKTTAKLTHRDGKPFKVLSVKADSPSATEFNVTFTPNDPANPTEYTIELTGTAGQTSQVIRGDLVIATEVPMEEEVRLPFFGTVRAGQ